MYKPNQPMQSAQDEDDSIFDDEDYSVRKRNFFFFKCWRGPPFMGTQKKNKRKRKSGNQTWVHPQSAPQR